MHDIKYLAVIDQVAPLRIYQKSETWKAERSEFILNSQIYYHPVGVRESTVA